jgi:hypothetical protein
MCIKRALAILLFVCGAVLSSRAGIGRPGGIGSWDGIGGRRAVGSLGAVGRPDAVGSRALDRDSLQPVRIGLHKIGGVKAVVWSRKLRFRFYSDLAGVSARLKLYPLAMKCYYNAVHVAGEGDTAALVVEEDELPQLGGPAERGTAGPAGVGLGAGDSAGRGAAGQTGVGLGTGGLAGLGAGGPMGVGARSEPIKMSDLLAAFEDGKEAASYAILAEVKQPVPGKRKAFTHINNVGHMFITLIKYNKDKSVVCRSFGFYPHKSSLFSATPIWPHSPSVVKDDAGHDWDEAAGKFISARRFRKIVEVLRSYDGRDYDLNHNNCTDFGLAIARLGGIGIAGASGHWPLGRGNNPGCAGQSMLEGKVSNVDEEDGAPLFVSTNIPAQR